MSVFPGGDGHSSEQAPYDRSADPSLLIGLFIVLLLRRSCFYREGFFLLGRSLLSGSSVPVPGREAPCVFNQPLMDVVVVLKRKHADSVIEKAVCVCLSVCLSVCVN